jgi:hypothetical protein
VSYSAELDRQCFLEQVLHLANSQRVFAKGCCYVYPSCTPATGCGTVTTRYSECVMHITIVSSRDN